MISIKKAVLIFLIVAVVAVGVYILVLYLGREPDAWESERRVEESESFGRNLVREIGACSRYIDDVIISRQTSAQIPSTSYQDERKCYFVIADQCQNKYGRDNPLFEACQFYGQVEVNRQINPN